MYTGVTSHRKVQRVAGYEQARAVLDKISRTPAGKTKERKSAGYPLGGHSKSVAWVREDEDASIAFTLYSTDVVVWHPDNSFDVENYGTTTTSDFAHHFLPDGIGLNYPSTRRGAEGGHRTILYKASAGAGWRDRRVCIGGVVRFVPQVDDIWLPDEDTCDTMVFPELDRKGARALAKKLHLRDFEAWLSMAPMHLDIEHVGWDLGHVVMALKHRDFATAAAHLPLIKPGSKFGNAKRIKPLSIHTRSWQEHVTMGSLDKLKLALWEDEGILDDVVFKTLPQAEFNRRMVRVRALDALDLRFGYGPN